MSGTLKTEVHDGLKVRTLHGRVTNVEIKLADCVLHLTVYGDGSAQLVRIKNGVRGAVAKRTLNLSRLYELGESADAFEKTGPAKKYSVLVTREATEHVYVEVEADSAEEAERLGLLNAQKLPGIAWKPDEGNENEPYIADPGNCAEAVEVHKPEPGRRQRLTLAAVSYALANLDDVNEAFVTTDDEPFTEKEFSELHRNLVYETSTDEDNKP